MIPYPTGVDISAAGGAGALSGMGETLAASPQTPLQPSFQASVYVTCTIDGHDVNAVVNDVRVSSFTRESRAYPVSNIGTVTGLRAK